MSEREREKQLHSSGRRLKRNVIQGIYWEEEAMGTMKRAKKQQVMECGITTTFDMAKFFRLSPSLCIYFPSILFFALCLLMEIEDLVMIIITVLLMISNCKTKEVVMR